MRTIADYQIEGEADLDVSDFFRGATTVISLLEVMDDKVNKLSRDIDKLSRKDIDIELNIDAMDELLKTEAMLKELDGRKITVDLEISGLDKAKIVAFDQISDGADRAHRSIGMGGIGGGGLIGAVLLLGSALGPVGVVASGWASAMVASLTTTGAAVGAFGALAIPTFMEVKKAIDDIGKAQEKIDAAKNVKELTAAQKEMDAVLKGIPEDIRAVVTQWQNFMTTYKNAAKIIRPDVLHIFAGAIQFLNTLLGKTVPVAVGAARGIQNLVNLVNKGIKGESWTRFFDYLTINAESFITTWGTALGNILTGLANIIVGLDPLTQKFNGGFLEMSQRFLEWSKNLGDNQGFQTFISEVLTKTPQVWETFKQFASTAWEVVKVLYQIGEAVLPIIAPVLQMARGFLEAHPGIAKVVTAVAALVVVIGPLSGIISAVGGAIAAIGFGPFAAILGVVAVALAVVAASGGKLGNTMRLLSEIWAELRVQAIGIWRNLQPLIEQFKQNIAPQFLAGFNSLLEAFKALLPVLKPLVTFLAVAVIANLQATGIAFRVLAQVIEVVAKVIGAVVRFLGAIFQWLFDLLIGHSILPELAAGFTKYLLGWIGPVKAAWSGFKNFVSGIWNSIKSLTSSAANAVGTIVRTVFGRLPGWVQGPVSRVISIMRGLPGQIRGALGNLGGLLVGAGRSLISGLISGISGMIGSLRSKLSSITSMIPSWKGPPTTDYKLLQDNGRLVMSGFIDKVDSMRGRLRSTLMQVTKDIDTYGKSSLGGSINVGGSGAASVGGGQNIGVYVAPGAIQVNGGSKGEADEILTKLTRISRFGQFQGPAKAGAL